MAISQLRISVRAFMLRSSLTTTTCPSCMLSRQIATTPVSRQEDEKGPVKFTKSGAYTLNPLMANEQKRRDTPWFQGPLVAFSTASCLLYFTMLREENDMDVELAGKLYDKVEGLEKMDLINSIKYNEEHGLDTRALKQRLKEVLQEEANSQ